MAAVSKIKLPDNTTLDVHDSRISGVTSSVTENSTDAITSGGVYSALNGLSDSMLFKGTLGTGGTITTLPTASSSNKGYTYKVITIGTYALQDAKVGDMFISDGSSWVLIPSGEPPILEQTFDAPNMRLFRFLFVESTVMDPTVPKKIYYSIDIQGDDDVIYSAHYDVCWVIINTNVKYMMFNAPANADYSITDHVYSSDTNGFYFGVRLPNVSTVIRTYTVKVYKCENCKANFVTPSSNGSYNFISADNGIVTYNDLWKTGSGSNSARTVLGDAKGSYSVSEGYYTTANGMSSHAEGSNTITPYVEGSHAEGRYNYSEFGLIHMVGVGTSNNRKNAVTISESGDIYIYNVSGYNGTSTSNQTSLQVHVDTTPLTDTDWANIFNNIDLSYLPRMMAIDDWPGGLSDYAEEAGYSSDEDYVNALISRAKDDWEGGNIYIRTDDVFIYDNTTYALYENIGDQVSCVNYAILPITYTYQQLYNMSMEANINNRYCPFYGFLNANQEVSQYIGEIVEDDHFSLLCIDN